MHGGGARKGVVALVRAKKKAIYFDHGIGGVPELDDLLADGSNLDRQFRVNRLKRFELAQRLLKRRTPLCQLIIALLQHLEPLRQVLDRRSVFALLIVVVLILLLFFF